MDAASLKTFAKKLQRQADKDPFISPDMFSQDLSRAFAISDPLKRQEQLYEATISYTCLLTTELANCSCGRELMRQVECGLDEYIPAYPPISPVTDSFFYTGMYLSHRFGADNETAAEIVLKVFQTWDVDCRCVELIKRLCCSRLGIYETRSVSGARILVRELVTNREFYLYASAGYAGQAGELRFSRVAIPAEVEGDTFFEVTTPYILTGCNADEWTEYLRANMPNTATRRDPLCGPDPGTEVLPHSDIADRLAALFEDDCGAMPWNEYIMDGYMNFTKSAIFLTGIPSRLETLPHHDAFQHVDDERSDWNEATSVKGGDFDISPNLIDEYGEYDHEELSEYFDTLHRLFNRSPEYDALADHEHSYIYLLFSLGRDYFSTLPITLSAAELNEILFDLIPRKVTMQAEQAGTLVREFQAFFRFLDREFSIHEAAQLAAVCDESAARRLRSKLADSSNFGMAKSFLSAGKASGFDMTSKADVAAFVSAYNQQLDSARDDVEDAPSTLNRAKPAVGRNEPCPCGSGKKFKKCCLKG